MTSALLAACCVGDPVSAVVRCRAMDLGRIRVVLVRARHSGNVGATARVLKNMGLGRLVLVAPHRFQSARAAQMAVHAREVLERRTTVDTLAEGVADCGLVIGTTSRSSAIHRGTVSPRQIAPEVLAATGANDVALVFGPEHHGLSNAELALCQRTVTIPTSVAYGSLNLAQAVLVCAYELFVAAHAGGAAAPTPPRAASARLEFMYAQLEDALRCIGYLHEGNADHMMLLFRRILGRADLGDHDVQVLLGVARQMRWAASPDASPSSVARVPRMP